jgi:hypothetical protein
MDRAAAQATEATCESAVESRGRPAGLCAQAARRNQQKPKKKARVATGWQPADAAAAARSNNEAMETRTRRGRG